MVAGRSGTGGEDRGINLGVYTELKVELEDELLKQSIKSDGVIKLFSDAQEEFSMFDPKFLKKVVNMKEKILW